MTCRVNEIVSQACRAVDLVTYSDYNRPLAPEKIVRDILLPVYPTISLDFANAISHVALAKSSVRHVALLI